MLFIRRFFSPRLFTSEVLDFQGLFLLSYTSSVTNVSKYLVFRIKFILRILRKTITKVPNLLKPKSLFRYLHSYRYNLKLWVSFIYARFWTNRGCFNIDSLPFKFQKISFSYLSTQTGSEKFKFELKWDNKKINHLQLYLSVIFFLLGF
jgi:hypothetical protein